MWEREQTVASESELRNKETDKAEPTRVSGRGQIYVTAEGLIDQAMTAVVRVSSSILALGQQA